MKIKKFNVVKLKNNHKATILEVLGNKYLAEIVNEYGIVLDKKIITVNEIKNVIYNKKKEIDRKTLTK